MKKMFMLIVLMLVFSSVFAESVILNDGRTLKGEVVGKKGGSIYLSSEGNIYLLTRDLVKQIKNDGNLTITKITYKKKDFVNDGVDITQLTPIGKREEVAGYDIPVAHIIQQPTHKTKMNLHTITLGLLFAGLAWDYFATAGDISDTIKDMEDLGVSNKEIDKVKKIKTRKIINGSLLSVASVVSFAVSFENVEIKASPTAVEVGYKF
ncbi:MAG: hypothetical protein PF570_03470 [Candidatus Cloacimonetes bacterium]|jgi:hypothetical protein|nr:hypothetical protein [Candidatus Cloacimonadota bacterium]